MKNGWIAAGVMIALVACAQPDQAPPPSATGTGWESTQAGSSLPETAPAPTLSTQRADAKRISIVELRQKVATGSAVLLDVRDPQSYSIQHAEGAISIPLQEVAMRAGELPRDKQIVTYCT
jgi:3-mercaptopyruvate sulfurtransferase SseA